MPDQGRIQKDLFKLLDRDVLDVIGPAFSDAVAQAEAYGDEHRLKRFLRARQAVADLAQVLPRKEATRV